MITPAVIEYSSVNAIKRLLVRIDFVVYFNFGSLSAFELCISCIFYFL